MTAATATKPSPPASVIPSKLSLANVKKGRLDEPDKILLYGPEGIGKSTFGAGAPSAIFLCSEQGTKEIDCARMPIEPTTFKDVLACVDLLLKERHDYKTLVIDSVDWLEPLIWEHICKRDKVASIEAWEGGFAKGLNVAAPDEWRILLRELERVQREAGMQVVLIGHSHIKTFENPEGPSYDRYELAVHKKAAGVLRQWVDIVLFTNWEGFAVKKEKDKAGILAKGKGVATGHRVVYSQRTAAYDAKTRWPMPASFPLSWADYEALRRESRDPKKLIDAITAAVGKLTEEDKKQALAAITRANGDVNKLSQLLGWVNKRLETPAEKEG